MHNINIRLLKIPTLCARGANAPAFGKAATRGLFAGGGARGPLGGPHVWSTKSVLMDSDEDSYIIDVANSS